MKALNGIIYIVLLFVVLFSCKTEPSQNENTKVVSEKTLAENLKNIDVQISGMTCEIGCARLIQSKLYKADGIKFAEVRFADSLGHITYDANRISPVQIKEVIQKVAGGDLYEVTGMTEVDQFKDLEPVTEELEVK